MHNTLTRETVNSERHGTERSGSVDGEQFQREDIQRTMAAQFNEPLDLEAALDRIRGQIPVPSDIEHVPLREAVGRILAEPLRSPLALPPFDNSAMDGYAISAPVDADLHNQTFRLIGTSAAGHPFDGHVSEGECVRIFTGAATPLGTTRVVLQEDVTAGEGTITISGHPDPRSNIRPQGHDLERGTVLDEAGTRINGFRIGRYAASGFAEVPVFPAPKIGVFSTGDELLPPGTPVADLPPGAIYESNRHALMALMADLPVSIVDLGNLPDEPAAVVSALSGAGESCDVVITSGGVSVGDHDHVKRSVEQLGELDFWRLNLKPGKPLAFGRLGNARFFGLPGNPVSTIVTWLLIARPAVLALCGATDRPPLRLTAELTSALQHTPGRTEYQRGRYAAASNGSSIQVSVTGHQASNRLSSFADANCLIEVPKTSADLPAGQLVQILPLMEL